MCEGKGRGGLRKWVGWVDGRGGGVRVGWDCYGWGGGDGRKDGWVGVSEKLGEGFGAMNIAGRVKVVLSGREAGTVQKIQFVRVF